MEVRSAEPLLATALVDNEELGAIFDSVVSGTAVPTEKVNPLKTGSGSVDGVLGGGLEGGGVVGVWGEGGSGAGEMCISLMADSLLRDAGAMAAVVDTTGNFDVLTLYAFVLARLQDDAALFGSLLESVGIQASSVEDVAAKVLDRVKIMRAFDLVGVMEAVGEVRDELEGILPREGEPPKPGGSHQDLPSEKDLNETSQEEILLEEPSREENVERPKEMPKRTFVADSDEEDELLFDDEPVLPMSTALPPPNAPPAVEDELLFFDGADERIPVSSPPWDSPSQSDPETPINVLSNATLSSKPSFLLIDNLAHVVTPLLRKDYIQAQNLTSSFLLTLSHLTRTHALHILILNPAAPPRPQSTKASENPNKERRQQPPPPPSIFSSNHDVPALMGMLVPSMDVGLLVGRTPRGKNDARAVYVDGEMVKRVRPGVKMVSVVEVVSDRWGGRVGEWGTFVCGERGVRDL
ncbi:hypothetical protein BU23DRAFT_581160 [Bimuria novae-zelandiae CBS 107.79]|uniref:Uncharacterized protein n=1 Tax=Bimuria novae-zelandiae CBS 107.79 TaxID=1447943 RepID=A0A6A5V4E8_9PLEO|nr:hypothetical protein BU23DRAFT_581160 [Bimuria novae-zelandiae CBS 107.79]